TADPLDPAVREWWTQKVNEIYKAIPDFGGFVVKANSEGQPGPQDYKRTHADGANMFADALAPHGGIVIWRAFVYSNEVPIDRVIDGSLSGYKRTGIAGVSNVGSDSNWTGSQFNQANWYAYGRLAWDPERSAEGIADEWVRQTFTNDADAVSKIVHMMMISR